LIAAAVVVVVVILLKHSLAMRVVMFELMLYFGVIYWLNPAKPEHDDNRNWMQHPKAMSG
jgi:hypothetical protein